VKQRADTFDQAGVMAGNPLELDHERHAPMHQIKHLLQGRRMVRGAADAQRSHLARCPLPDATVGPRQPEEAFFFKNDWHAVAGQAHVALDRITLRCCRLEGGKRVFPDQIVAIMQAAMSDRPRGQPGQIFHARLTQLRLWLRSRRPH
jgi:hypothetical protein